MADIQYKIRREGGVFRLRDNSIIFPRSPEWFSEYIPYFRSGGETLEPDPLPPQSPPDLNEEKNKRKALVDQYAAGLRTKVVSNISPAEMASWAKKEELARKIKEVPETPSGPLIMEAAARGISLDILVDKIIYKADLFWQLEAIIAGVNGKHNDNIDLLQTVEEVQNYNFLEGWPEL